MKKPTISMIACIGKNRELGKNNKLLWNIPEDMQRFRDLTVGHVVIMGQSTFESIGRALPGRTNIVLTRDERFDPKGCQVCYSVDQALKEASEVEKEEIFVIGGGQIYKQFAPLCENLYLTIVDRAEDADTFFPQYDEFKIYKEGEDRKSVEGIKYKFLELTRNAKSKR